MLFKRIYPAALTEAVSTRDASIYLLKGFHLAGLSSPQQQQRETLGYRIWMIVVLFFAMAYVPLSYAFNYIDFTTKFTPVEFLTSLQVSLNTWGFAIKLIILFCMRGRLYAANDYLDELDRSCCTKREMQQIRSAVAYGNRITFIFCIVYGSYTTSNFVASLFSHRLPFNIFNPFFDWQTNYVKFLMQATFEFITVGFVVFMEQLTDCYAIVYVYNVRIHIALLTARIRNLSDCTTSNAKRQRALLINCIIDHKHILNFCSTIRPIISGTIFVQFLVCGSVIGVAMINLMFFANYYVAISTIIYLFAVLLQTFPLCYNCNCLIEDCTAMADALFHTTWYSKNHAYRKLLLFYLRMAQKPITFNAMNMFTITLSTNIQFAKIALSIYTLAQGMNTAAKFTRH